MKKNNPQKQISRERIEKAARMYNSSVAAAAGMGISASAFGRLCHEFGILTPRERLRAAKK